MICIIGLILFLVVWVVLHEIGYKKTQSNKIQGKEDQQRYGAKYGVGKIVSYKKTWYGWVKK